MSKFFEGLLKECEIKIEGVKKQATRQDTDFVGNLKKIVADNSDTGFGSEINNQNPAVENGSPDQMMPGQGIYEEQVRQSPTLSNRVFNKALIEQESGINIDSFISSAMIAGVGEMDKVLGLFYVYSGQDQNFDNLLNEYIQSIMAPKERGNEPQNEAQVEQPQENIEEKSGKLVVAEKDADYSEVFNYFYNFFSGKGADELKNYWKSYQKEKKKIGSADVDALMYVVGLRARGYNKDSASDISHILINAGVVSNMFDKMDYPQVIVDNVLFEKDSSGVWIASKNFDNDKFKKSIVSRVRLLRSLQDHSFYGQDTFLVKAGEKLYTLDLLGSITAEASFEKQVKQMSDNELIEAKKKILAGTLTKESVEKIKEINEELLNRGKNDNLDQGPGEKNPVTEVVDTVWEDVNMEDYSTLGNKSTEQPSYMSGETSDKPSGGNV